MTIHAFSSFSYSYLNRARVLFKTLRSLHPDWILWAVMVDEPPPGFAIDLRQEDFDQLLNVTELFGDKADQWLFSHDIVEACTAVKGAALARLLSIPDCEKVFFFDPDIAIFNSMGEVVSLLDRFSIVLTPHQVDPEPREDRSSIRDNEVTSLGYGVFNLGFVAVSSDEEGRRFARWWDERLRDWCHDRLEIGLFVDQKWCNLVPCFFDGVKILRDPGYNVASWNLSQRNMSFDAAGTALINDRPLRFFHFTKLGPVADRMTLRYAQENAEIYELWRWYREEVKAASTSAIPKGWWHYGTFDNGVTVPKEVRELYRERSDLQTAFPRPFQTIGESFFNWLKDNTSLLSGDQSSRGFMPA